METLKYIIANIVQHPYDINDDSNHVIFDIYLNTVLHKFILASNTLIKDVHNVCAPNLYANRITRKMYYIANICYYKQSITAADAANAIATYTILCKMYNTTDITMLYIDATNCDASYIYSHDEIPHATFCGLNDLLNVFQINFQFTPKTYDEFIGLMRDSSTCEYSPLDYYYSPDSSPVIDGLPFTPMRKNAFVTPPRSNSPLLPPGAPKKAHCDYCPLYNDDNTADEIMPLIL